MDKKPATVYLAGGMRGYKEFNFPAFDAMRDQVEELGYTVISPADLDRRAGLDVTGLTGNESLEDLGFNLRHAMAKDLMIITTVADAVVVLDGWKESRGAKAEVATAQAIGIPVLELWKSEAGTWLYPVLDSIEVR